MGVLHPCRQRVPAHRLAPSGNALWRLCFWRETKTSKFDACLRSLKHVT